MSLSKDFFSKIAVTAALLLVTSGCASHRPMTGDAPPSALPSRIAVLPLENLSGGAVPMKETRRELLDQLTAQGVKVMADPELEAFMARRRLRYTGGVDEATAHAFKAEAGVDGVIITSVELYAETYPPRIAMTTRLVATEDAHIVRMASVAMAGDDAPGLFGLGLVENPQHLRTAAVQRLTARLLGRERAKPVELSPVTQFRLPAIGTKGGSIAVLPFLNRSGRKYAGEVVALHFLRELVDRGIGPVIEPGVLRDELLRYRVIMEEGVSLADAEVIFGRLKADRLLTGTVNDYEEQQGGTGTPKLDFSALLLDKENRRTVWDVGSRYDGRERVYLFDFGKITTASGLAAAMVRGAVKSLK